MITFLFRLRLTLNLLDYLFNVEKLQNRYLNTKKLLNVQSSCQKESHTATMKQIENPAKLKSKDYSPVIVTNSFKNKEKNAILFCTPFSLDPK